MKDIAKQLSSIRDNEENSIRGLVATEALEYGDTPETFFIDLSKHGCESGMVNSLIYYVDTHAFYDQHYEEIEELRVEFEEQCGVPLKIPYNLKNFLAWFAFEQTASKMTDELGIF